MLLGLALYNQTILDLKFPLVLYKKLLTFKKNINFEEVFSIEDLEEIEPDLVLTFKNILS
jgi:hypothetical protein